MHTCFHNHTYSPAVCVFFVKGEIRTGIIISDVPHNTRAGGFDKQTGLIVVIFWAVFIQVNHYQPGEARK